MSASMKRIEVPTNYGSLIVVVDHSHPDQSDEESTEVVMNRKPSLESQVSLPMEEDIWWQMNQDFACECVEAEFCRTSEKAVVKPQVEKVSPSAPPLGDDEWMEINQDFARDNSHMEVEENESVVLPSKSESSLEEPYGDYGVWWE